MRTRYRLVAPALAMLLLTACGTGTAGSADPAPSGTGAAVVSPSADASPVPVDVGVLTIGQLAGALPSDDELPSGTSEIERCPGADDQTLRCDSVDDSTTALLGATLPGDDEGLFFGPGISLGVAKLDDSTPRSASREAVEERVGEFRIDGETFDDGAFVPDERGEGTIEDVAVGGWSGFILTTSVQQSAPGEQDWADPQASATLMVFNDETRYTCNARGPAGASTQDMAELCRGLADDFVSDVDALAEQAATS